MVLALLDVLLKTLRDAAPLNLLAHGGPSLKGNSDVIIETVITALCSGPTCLHSDQDTVQMLKRKYNKSKSTPSLIGTGIHITSF